MEIQVKQCKRDYMGRIVNGEPIAWEGKTKEELYERFEKENNRLRYCERWFEFVDSGDKESYKLWRESLSQAKSMSMYYLGNIVD